jgi:hypothetical protein
MFVVLALATILTALVIRSPDPAGVTHQDPRLDVSAHVPEGWHTQSFDDEVGLATHTGFVVSNIPHYFRHPDLRGGETTSGWDMKDLPPHAVVLEISRVVRLPVACSSEAGNMSITAFPLSLEQLETITTSPRYGAPPRRYLGVCLEDGKHFGVHAWFFPQASEHDRDLAAELISSIQAS